MVRTGSDFSGVGELWEDIPLYEGFYQVSTLGRVRSLDRVSSNPINNIELGVVLKPSLKRGYECYVLQKNGVRKYKSAHRIVAETFILNPNNYTQVNHKNANKRDNNINNLEWCTPKQNIRHAWRLGVSKPRVGNNHHSNKLQEKDIPKIRVLLKKQKVKEICELYSVSRGCIESIKNNLTWKHVK